MRLMSCDFQLTSDCLSNVQTKIEHNVQDKCSKCHSLDIVLANAYVHFYGHFGLIWKYLGRDCSD